jgi:purine-binding chemotaxis protein CheW
MSDFETICTFTLDSLFLGIHVSEVHEVLLAQTLTPVPRAHPVVSGLINMRGQIVPAVDLRRVLSLPPRTDDAPPPINVIVGSGSSLLSLLVDQVGDVLEIDSRLFTAPPDTTPTETKNFFRGAFQLPQQLLLVFDISRTMDAIVALAKSEQRRRQT